MEHDLPNHASVGNGARFRLFQISAAQRFEKAPVNVHPKVALQVVMGFSHVKHTRQHQPLHQLHQPPVATGPSDDQMEVGISLNLLTICIDAAVGRLLRFFHDSLKLRKVILSKLPKTQLYGEQVESIDKSENFGMVGSRPCAQIKTARRPALRDSNLFKAMKCVTDGRPAYVKSTREILFAQPLVGDKFPFSHSIEDSENNPVGECAINRFRGEAR